MVGGGAREQLDLYTPEISARLDQFKNRKIRDHIAQKVVLQRPFQQWRNQISFHRFNTYLPGEREWRRRNAAKVAGIGTRKREQPGDVNGDDVSSSSSASNTAAAESPGVPIEPPLKIAKVSASGK